MLFCMTAVGIESGAAQSLSSPNSAAPIIDDLAPAEAATPRSVIFFPPVPPPLDRPVSHLAAPQPAQLTPPAELALFVNEVFYAPLSTRLARNDLDDKLRQRLASYRTTRTVLQDELRSALARVRDAEPSVRQSALEILGRQQAQRLTELEKTAERLREDLVTAEYNWSALREWHLGEAETRGDSPLEASQVIRAYAFYHPGLLAAQRGLLREIALEITLAAGDTAAAAAAQPFLFFSPEMARVQLTDDLPAALALRVAEYQTKKSALKKELYDAVYEQEGASFLRGNTLKAVADRQVPRLAALEKLAEEIRHSLAGLLAPPRAGEHSPMPPVLTARVADLLRNRTSLVKDTQAMVEDLRRRILASGAPIQVTYSFDASGLKFTVQPRRSFRDRPTGALKLTLESVGLEMSALAADFGRRFADLANETEAIRHDAAESLGHAEAPAVDAALAEAVRFAALQETDDAYRDYRTAVFEPGLSPEQRRLLFGRALLELDLPLPQGARQPTLRGAW